MFCQGITISFEENTLNNLLLPGTTIEVIMPVSKLAFTSCTKPSLLPSTILITSLCLKSNPLFPIKTPQESIFKRKNYIIIYLKLMKKTEDKKAQKLFKVFFKKVLTGDEKSSIIEKYQAEHMKI